MFKSHITTKRRNIIKAQQMGRPSSSPVRPSPGRAPRLGQASAELGSACPESLATPRNIFLRWSAKDPRIAGPPGWPWARLAGVAGMTEAMCAGRDQDPRRVVPVCTALGGTWQEVPHTSDGAGAPHGADGAARQGRHRWHPGRSRDGLHPAACVVPVAVCSTSIVRMRRLASVSPPPNTFRNACGPQRPASPWCGPA